MTFKQYIHHLNLRWFLSKHDFEFDLRMVHSDTKLYSGWQIPELY